MDHIDHAEEVEDGTRLRRQRDPRIEVDGSLEVSVERTRDEERDHENGVQAHKKSKTNSRSRAKRAGTKPYPRRVAAASRTIMSSVCRLGVADSRRLYMKSARMIPTPIAGNNRTRRPWNVRCRR